MVAWPPLGSQEYDPGPCCHRRDSRSGFPNQERPENTRNSINIFIFLIFLDIHVTYFRHQACIEVSVVANEGRIGHFNRSRLSLDATLIANASQIVKPGDGGFFTAVLHFPNTATRWTHIVVVSIFPKAIAPRGHAFTTKDGPPTVEAFPPPPSSHVCLNEGRHGPECVLEMVMFRNAYAQEKFSPCIS